MRSTRSIHQRSLVHGVFTAALFAALVGSARHALAEPAFDFTGFSDTGVANPNGPGRTGGYRFAVSQDMVVTALGHWDRDLDGIEEDRPMGLWTAGGDLLALVTMPAGTDTTLIDRFRYYQLSHPVFLSAGQNYVIGVFYTTNAGGIAAGVQNLTAVPGIQFLNSHLSAFGPEIMFPAYFGPGQNDPSFFGPNLDVTPVAEALAELGRQPAVSFTGHTPIGPQQRTTGWNFTVDHGMLVTDLGLWDRDLDGNEESRPIGLWDEAGTLLATVTMPVGLVGEVDGNFRYLPIDPPVMVLPGQTYTIGGFYTTSAGGLAGHVTGLETVPGFTVGQPVTNQDATFQKPTTGASGFPGLFGASLRFAHQDVCPGFDDNIDTDNDSIPDGCDVCANADDNVDADADLVPDDCDNCLALSNADQADSDGDGVGDVCDVCPGFDDNVDADADGVPDGCDVCANADDNVDADADGVPDGCDVCPGFDDNADADADGVPDECDVCANADDNVDADADGVPDVCDNCPNAANADQADTDNDGTGDICDACPNDEDTVDADGDGVSDCNDLCSNTDAGAVVDANGCPVDSPDGNTIDNNTNDNGDPTTLVNPDCGCGTGGTVMMPLSMIVFAGMHRRGRRR